MTQTKKTIEEKKNDVLKKVYGGQRKPYMHDFSLKDGKCTKCNVFIGGSLMRLCPVIGREEVEEWRIYE